MYGSRQGPAVRHDLSQMVRSSLWLLNPTHEQSSFYLISFVIDSTTSCAFCPITPPRRSEKTATVSVCSGVWEYLESLLSCIWH